MTILRPRPCRLAPAAALLIGFAALAAVLQAAAQTGTTTGATGATGTTGPASAPDLAPALPAASVPLGVRPGPRLLTPTETRNSATAPGDLRPERPVTPQIRIPFGKAPSPVAPVAPAPPVPPVPPVLAPGPFQARPGESGQPLPNGPARAAEAAHNARNARAAARCEALVGEQVRAKCRDALAREARGR